MLSEDLIRSEARLALQYVCDARDDVHSLERMSPCRMSTGKYCQLLHRLWNVRVFPLTALTACTSAVRQQRAFNLLAKRGIASRPLIRVQCLRARNLWCSGSLDVLRGTRTTRISWVTRVISPCKDEYSLYSMCGTPLRHSLYLVEGELCRYH